MAVKVNYPKISSLDNNHLIIVDPGNKTTTFTSFERVIVMIVRGKVYLDEHFYKYSPTTIKRRNIFLNMSSDQVNSMIAAGTFELTRLNESYND